MVVSPRVLKFHHANGLLRHDAMRLLLVVEDRDAAETAARRQSGANAVGTQHCSVFLYSALVAVNLWVLCS
jgi:hypothetical protein